MFSSINGCPNKWLINVYFSHLTTNYEEPYNVRFENGQFLPLIAMGFLKISQTHQTLLHI